MKKYNVFRLHINRISARETNAGYKYCRPVGHFEAKIFKNEKPYKIHVACKSKIQSLAYAVLHVAELSRPLIIGGILFHNTTLSLDEAKRIALRYFGKNASMPMLKKINDLRFTP